MNTGKEVRSVPYLGMIQKGVLALIGLVLVATCVGCGPTGGDSSSGTKSAKSENAQSAPVVYAEDALVDPKAEWEKVTQVPDSRLIEGMNYRDGELWFIDVGASKIQKVVDGQSVDVYVDETHGAMPNGAKFIDNDTMLITDRAQGLCTYNVVSGEYKVHASAFEGTKFLGLNDLVLDGNGGAYFTDPGQSDYLTKNGCVYYVNYGDGSYAIEKISDGFAYPNGITISPDGKFLYVAEFNTNSIICVPSKTYTEGKDTPYVVARLSGGHGPDGVLTDMEGNIYSAHLNAGEVAVVDAQGFEVVNVRLPESASPLVSNVLIHEGYLYVTEFGNGVIWRIPIKAEPNPLG